MKFDVVEAPSSPLLNNGTVIPLLNNGTVIPLLNNGTVIPLLDNGTVIPLLDSGIQNKINLKYYYINYPYAPYADFHLIERLTLDPAVKQRDDGAAVKQRANHYP